MSAPATTYTYERPQVVCRYKKQVAFIDAPTRSAIIEATSKAGKTVGCIVWLFEQAVSPYGWFYFKDGQIIYDKEVGSNKEGFYYWWVAPVSSVAKIAYRRMKRFINPKEIYKYNDTELTITLRFNGATMCFKSADNPDSLFGEDVYASVLDESTRMKEDAYTAVDSTLTATKGCMRIIGNVKGTGNWSYKLARRVERKELSEWTYFRLTAADAVEAGVLDQKILDEKKSRLPLGTYLELYYAIPNEKAGDKFAFAFSKEKHVKTVKWNPNEFTYLSFDFNRNPICCSVIQWYDDTVKIPRVIKLENSNIYNLIEYIQNEFGQAYYIVCGDYTGTGKTAYCIDDMNYFDIIKARLNLPESSMQQIPNPKLKDNKVLVNSVFEHYPVEIDPDGAAALIFDCEFVKVLADGSIKKTDREDPEQQADAIDTLRYWINRYLSDYFSV